VRLGRRVFDNLRKSMGFIIAIHVPIAGLALLPLIFGLPILLWPIHIAFLEMVIDPVCTLVFEAETEEEGIMQRPPRDSAAPLFSASLLGWSVLQGVVVLALTAGIFLVALDRDMPEPDVRSLTFFALVFGIVGLIFVNRSFSASIITAFRRRNAALRWVLLVVTVMLGVTLLVPFARRMFRFGSLHLDDLAVTAAAGLLTIVILEVLKPHWRKRLMN